MPPLHPPPASAFPVEELNWVHLSQGYRFAKPAEAGSHCAFLQAFSVMGYGHACVLGVRGMGTLLEGSQGALGRSNEDQRLLSQGAPHLAWGGGVGSLFVPFAPRTAQRVLARGLFLSQSQAACGRGAGWRSSRSAPHLPSPSRRGLPAEGAPRPGSEANFPSRDEDAPSSWSRTKVSGAPGTGTAYCRSVAVCVLTHPDTCTHTLTGMHVPVLTHLCTLARTSLSHSHIPLPPSSAPRGFLRTPLQGSPVEDDRCHQVSIFCGHALVIALLCCNPYTLACYAIETRRKGRSGGCM